jgi:hypothetical protein
MADDEYDPDALDAKEEEDDDNVSQEDKGAAAQCCALHHMLPQLLYDCTQRSMNLFDACN